MRKLIRTSLLVLAMFCATYAGDMPIDYTNPTPDGDMPINYTNPTSQPASDSDGTTSSDGWIGTGLAETVMGALGSVLSLV